MECTESSIPEPASRVARPTTLDARGADDNRLRDSDRSRLLRSSPPDGAGTVRCARPLPSRAPRPDRPRNPVRRWSFAALIVAVPLASWRVCVFPPQYKISVGSTAIQLEDVALDEMLVALHADRAAASVRPLDHPAALKHACRRRGPLSLNAGLGTGAIPFCASRSLRAGPRKTAASR